LSDEINNNQNHVDDHANYIPVLELWAIVISLDLPEKKAIEVAEDRRYYNAIYYELNIDMYGFREVFFCTLWQSIENSWEHSQGVTQEVQW